MRTLITLLIVIAFFRSSSAQQKLKQQVADSEFPEYSNGLIYSDTTIGQLRHIADSLNLKYKVCDLARDYYSYPQASAFYIDMKGAKARAIKKDMMNNIPFEELVHKYPDITIDSDVWVVKFSEGYSGKKQVLFESFNLSGDGYQEISTSDDGNDFNKLLKHKWIFSFHDTSQWSTEETQAFYFTSEFTSTKLPVAYERKIQYSDCLVDTGTTVMLPGKDDDGYSYKTNKNVTALEDFLKGKLYLHYRHERIKKKTKNEISLAEILYPGDDNNKILNYISDSLSKSDDFKRLLTNAVASAIEKGGSNDILEYLTQHFYSGKLALQLKRGRRVIGMCSMDSRPRTYAVEIAKLSAETVNWPVFLRAHLDIMNDRFERASDGSYAWGRRKTYIKELEALQINVPDLMFGISFRIQNSCSNHYYSSIGRIGRALVESKDAVLIEDEMAQMISDSALDTFNRIIICYLFKQYLWNNEDDGRRNAALDKLKKAVSSLPPSISKTFRFEYRQTR